MKKRPLVILAAVLLFVAGVYYFYWSYHPRISISAATAIPAEADYHNERVMVAIAHHRGISAAARVEKELTRMADWNDQVATELYAYTTPYDIRVSGENGHGHVTLRYEGYVTTKDGERLDYFRENTFDLFVRDKDFRVKARENAKKS